MASLAHWFRLIRVGDWTVIVLGVALTVWLTLATSHEKAGEPVRALVRSEGRIVADIRLPTRQKLTVPGPLGRTVVVVEDSRIRIDEDPGPKQYCVTQGALSRAGDIAVCLPNRVSIQLQGQSTDYDSFSY